tara:strand:+ start:6941 stop:7819 length:879 start_codon:yes stop_codon:yes gene_type:complete
MNSDFVVPIPPSYNQSQELCLKDVDTYIKFLEKSGVVSTVMTTAGTSQYNLLSDVEIMSLNYQVSLFSNKKIIGLPAKSLIELKKFIASQKAMIQSDNCHYMGLYPDRFYDNKTIIDYFSFVSEYVESPIYVHGMFMRAGRGGQWNFTADVLNELFDRNLIVGIKEEHSDLAASYNFILNLNPKMDIIVAGGSMRRHKFLRNAGANSFLSGVGNLCPHIENTYILGNESAAIEKENKLFTVFNKHGWHRSLRIALSILNLGCKYDRMPWSQRDDETVADIHNVIKEIGIINE